MPCTSRLEPGQRDEIVDCLLLVDVQVHLLQQFRERNSHALHFALSDTRHQSQPALEPGPPSLRLDRCCRRTLDLNPTQLSPSPQHEIGSSAWLTWTCYLKSESMRQPAGRYLLPFQCPASHSQCATQAHSPGPLWGFLTWANGPAQPMCFFGGKRANIIINLRKVAAETGGVHSAST